MKLLIIEEEAERELAGSVAFYEQRQSGLGLDFERATREAQGSRGHDKRRSWLV